MTVLIGLSSKKTGLNRLQGALIGSNWILSRSLRAMEFDKDTRRAGCSAGHITNVGDQTLAFC